MKKTIAVLALALALLLGACAEEPARTGASAEEPSPSASTSDVTAVESPAPTPHETSEATPAPAGAKRLEVWFVYGERLFATHRSVAATPAVGRAAMEELLARPNDFEANAGVATAIPPGIELLALQIADGTATVDLSEGFGEGSGSTGEILSIAQVVYTLTQFPTVDDVLFEVEGEPLKETPGHGLLLSGPQTRRDWQDQLPSILVTEPTMGERVSSPVTVAGTADVFEATVQMRLLDAQGNRLDRAFTTATCGTGCRGDFSHDLEFSVETEQHGVLEVWWDSPEDGSRKDVVRIAVTLEP